MNHNDIFRRLRYALRLNDTATIAIFELVDYKMEGLYLRGLMKKDEESGFIPCRDKILNAFLDGLIILKRGKKNGQPPSPLSAGTILTNNEILRKIRIAMTFKDDDIIALLSLANFRISKSELSALFRKPEHRNYKECGDQLLRNLLQGMSKKYRGDDEKFASSAKKKSHKIAEKRVQKPASAPAASAKPAAKTPPPSSVWGDVSKK